MSRLREGTESAVVVPVPAAEPVVGEWRRRLDPAASWGVPAHVTILYPFMPPERIDDSVVDALAAVAASSVPFEFGLRRTDRFGDEVLFLAPEPGGEFLRLIDAVAARWPEHPPYGGMHETVVPHLTIAQGAEVDEMRWAAEAITASLPLETRADRLWLMEGSYAPGSWRTVAEFPLGGR